jgi:cell division protein FtsI (penicillin-binding protein 3)
VTNPAVVIAVTLHGTKDGNAGFGGPAAAPVFREVAETALRVLEIPKDLRDDKIDYSKEISVAESVPGPDAMLGQEPVVISSITQPPAPELLARPGSQNPGDRRTFSEDSGPRVPNFKGLSMRAVLEQSMAEGIPVALSGSGVARAQTPEPGTILPAGERVHIQLAR